MIRKNELSTSRIYKLCPACEEYLVPCREVAGRWRFDEEGQRVATHLYYIFVCRCSAHFSGGVFLGTIDKPETIFV